MAEIIRFDTGIKTFSLNGEVEVKFNPSDTAFLGKIFDAVEKLEGKESAYRAEAEKLNTAAIFALAKKCDNEMREIIDAVFDVPVCTALFPEGYVMALADGFPRWANLLYAIVEMMDASTGPAKERAQERVRKYSAKYRKK